MLWIDIVQALWRTVFSRPYSKHNGILSDFVVGKLIALRLNKDPSFYEVTLFSLLPRWSLEAKWKLYSTFCLNILEKKFKSSTISLASLCKFSKFLSLSEYVNSLPWRWPAPSILQNNPFPEELAISQKKTSSSLLLGTVWRLKACLYDWSYHCKTGTIKC